MHLAWRQNVCVHKTDVIKRVATKQKTVQSFSKQCLYIIDRTIAIFLICREQTTYTRTKGRHNMRKCIVTAWVTLSEIDRDANNNNVYEYVKCVVCGVWPIEFLLLAVRLSKV